MKMMRTMMMAALFAAILAASSAFAGNAEVTRVSARKAGGGLLVDISCKVTGIDGATNGLKFAVSAGGHNASRFWVMQGGMRLNDREVHTNGIYRLRWDALADGFRCDDDEMFDDLRVSVVVDTHEKVQLWEGGPFWATTNIGAEKPEGYGYYFWWGDTVGYKREGGVWVASDKSGFVFGVPNTFVMRSSELREEGLITADNVLAPEYDAAWVRWGGAWRMPTAEELEELSNTNKCDWTWTSRNGVNGYVVRGKDKYEPNSIFLPCAGYGYRTSLYDAGSLGGYWSSVPFSDRSFISWYLGFDSSRHDMHSYYRYYGQSVRPVQGGGKQRMK